MALLEAKNLVKRYGAAAALDGVSMRVEAGETVGVVGENGAGKSTFVHILSGAVRADSGEIYFENRIVNFRSPREAAAAGIGIVHQHEALIPKFSISENLALAAPLAAFPKKSLLRRHALELYERYGLNPGDPDTPCDALSVGARQRVEILKSLATPKKLLLLDEPTAALAPSEIAEFLTIVERLRASGVSLVLVDHKLHEVLSVCSRVVVLRRGKVVTEVDATQTNANDLSAAMVGHPISRPARPRNIQLDEILLSVENVSAASTTGSVALDHIQLTVSRGEIVGIAGVDGNGQTELIEALLKLRKLSSGRIIAKSIAAIPPDRHAEGLVLDFGIGENLLLDNDVLNKTAPRGFLTKDAVAQLAQDAIVQFKIRAASPAAPLRSLSGGNQQKVAAARAFLRKPDVLLAAHATRGLDVDAAAAVQNEILAFAERGGSVVFISADLDEIVNMCHRMFVISRGRLIGPF
ncbi:MAG: ABC transporter ATP-binding protein, partial [Planctomycetota bacterium]